MIFGKCTQHGCDVKNVNTCEKPKLKKKSMNVKNKILHHCQRTSITKY